MKSIGNGLFHFLFFIFGSLAATVLIIVSLVVLIPIVAFGFFRKKNFRKKEEG